MLLTRQRSIGSKYRKTRKNKHAMDKNIILTFVIGKDRHYIQYTKSHMENYAKKCGAEFILLTENDPLIKKHNSIFKDIPTGRGYGGTSWFLKISIIHHFLNIYDKVLWLDDSCIVSPYTENVFNEVKDGYIGGVKDKPRAANWLRAYLKLTMDTEIDRDIFINSGVVVYTKKMRDILSIKNILKHKHLFMAKYPHQAFITYMFHINKIPIILFNKNYNDLYLHYKNNMLRNAVNKEYIVEHRSSIFHITGAWRNRLNVIKEIDSIVKEYMTENNIFLYWNGHEPSLITLLRKIIINHSNHGRSYKVNLINSGNLHEYIKTIPDYFEKLQEVHKADFIRVNVLCERGGIWLDSDTLVMNNLQPLFKIIREQDGFFILENNTKLCNGVFGTKPNTEFMLAWRNSMHELLTQNFHIGWNEIGSSMIEKIRSQSPDILKNYKIFNGLDNMYPVNWKNCVTEYIDKPYENYKTLVRPFQPLIILVGDVYRKLNKYTQREIIDGNMPLSYFINKSLNSESKKTRKIRKKPKI